MLKNIMCMLGIIVCLWALVYIARLTMNDYPEVANSIYIFKLNENTASPIIHMDHIGNKVITVVLQEHIKGKSDNRKLKDFITESILSQMFKGDNLLLDSNLKTVDTSKVKDAVYFVYPITCKRPNLYGYIVANIAGNGINIIELISQFSKYEGGVCAQDFAIKV